MDCDKFMELCMTTRVLQKTVPLIPTFPMLPLCNELLTTQTLTITVLFLIPIVWSSQGYHLAEPSGVSPIGLLIQQCLNEADPRMPLHPDSNHTPASFPVIAFGTILASLASKTNQHWFFSLTPYRQATTGSQIHQPASMGLLPTYTDLSLGFYFD